MEIVSRSKAKELGLIKYFSGSVCKYGHVSERYTRNGSCFECDTERWKQQSSVCVNLRTKKSYYKHLNERRQKAKEYYQNDESKRVNRNERSISWREDNSDYIKEYEKNYRITNSKSINAKNSKRRAIKLKALPNWANLKRIKDIYINCPQGHHVDHIIPLQGELVCGLHVESNLQYLSATENLKKNNRFCPVTIENKGDKYA